MPTGEDGLVIEFRSLWTSDSSVQDKQNIPLVSDRFGMSNNQ